MLAMPQYLGSIKPVSMEDAMSGKTPTVATVKKYQGEAAAKAVIEQIIGEASALINVSRNLTVPQIEFLADEILSTYYYLTLADLRFVMREGVTGKYGDIFDRLDVRVVTSWVDRYVSARLNAAEGRNMNARKKDEPAGNAVPMPDWFVNFLRKFEASSQPKAEFEPDEAFWQSVDQEWSENTDPARPTLKQFQTMRLAQVKAMFKQ